MSVNNQSKKTAVNRYIFTAGCVIIYALIVGIIISFADFTAALSGEDAEVFKDTKLVIYEGPSTLKEATEDDLKATSESLRDISLMKSGDTKVSVNGNELFVYETNVNNQHSWNADPALSRTPVTYFDFDGTVEITVEAKGLKELESAVVRPLSYDIKPEIDKEKKTVTFRVSNPDAYTVEFNGSVARAVHIFANEYDESILPENIDTEKVRYIGPGEWNIDTIVLDKGETLVVAGGAVVHGQIVANQVSDITVKGRGIIDGSLHEGWRLTGTTAKVPFTFNDCANVMVDGVISLNSNAWCMQLYNVVKADINNVKIVSARSNGDGISVQSSQHVTVTNSFLRTWDDALVVKNYSDMESKNITFKGIQIWTDLAQSMEVGFETNKGCIEDEMTISKVVFEDITVLHNFHKPVVSIHNGDDAHVTDITFKNIIVEDAKMGLGDGVNNLIEIQILFNSNWSKTKERGTISNVLIDGLTVIDGNDTLPSVIEGFDAEHGVDGVTIKNLNIKGKDIKSLEDGNIKVNDKTAKNVTIE